MDHRVTEVVGWHVAKRGDRWAALEPVRQGVRTHMAAYAPRNHGWLLEGRGYRTSTEARQWLIRKAA